MGEGKTLLRMGVLALMWGSSFFWIKLGLNAFSPVQLVLIRLVLGAAVLLVLCYGYRARLPRGGRVWLHLGVAALFHNAVPFLLFAIGEQTVDSGTTGVLNATTPLWALVVALLWRVDRGLNAARVAGLVVGLAGTALIFAPWRSSDLLSWGSVAILAGAMSYGFVFVYEQRFLTGSGASPVALAGSQMLAASGFLLLATPFAGLSPIRLDPGAVLAVVVLGVFSTGIAFAVNYRLLATEGAVAAATVGYLMPVVSILLGTLLLNEHLNPRVVAGMVVVLLGVALTRVRRNRAGGRAEPDRGAELRQESGTLP
ncbi:DMT family transporter [Amycolatopsis cihanbeyliensis]|uniref:Drug/metabolite transporter (DMT)-like permease n=1 Tax=Amycolatopsis cihanbeyliensis TaxID=1128664 RepID=A0A542DJ42_AMYCI|nr:DMT family transporter [Amycolatopsis cihanbeyliensis]TQJ03086.1 drug/metabolite transporter (DMT)-like permease [Amycolatopsis cihanbeyliensis]